MKRMIGLLALVMLAGCADLYINSTEPRIRTAWVVQTVDKDRYFEAVPDPAQPCAPAVIDYVDKAKDTRQRVIDWDATIDVSNTYTLTDKGRQELIEHIKYSGRNCPKPYLIASKKFNYSSEGSQSFARSYAFVLYWLDGDKLYLKPKQLTFATNDQTGQTLLQPIRFNFGRWDELRAYRNARSYEGPVALPQIVYRIDEHRFFEMVPYSYMICGWARLYYTDTAKGIHSNVADWDSVAKKDTLIIDAANDQYLIGPIIKSGSDCQTGSGSSRKCSPRLPYSTDAGRSWKHNIPWQNSNTVLISGDQVFTGGRANIHDLQEGYVKEAWHAISSKDLPKPRKAPLDTTFHCIFNEME